MRSGCHHLQYETGSSDVIKVSELIVEIPGQTEARHLMLNIAAEEIRTTLDTIPF